jgi:hypothetical protein
MQVCFLLCRQSATGMLISHLYKSLRPSDSYKCILLTKLRQRRVKCDESKPECIRCQNLGRECGGYAPEAHDDASKYIAPVAIHPRPMSIMTYAPSVAIPGDQQERRYFQRFCDKTAGEICGSFDPTFWTEKVPQLCHQDPPIRYVCSIKTSTC